MRVRKNDTHEHCAVEHKLKFVVVVVVVLIDSIPWCCWYYERQLVLLGAEGRGRNEFLCSVLAASKKVSTMMVAYKGEPCGWTWEELQGRQVPPSFKPKLVRGRFSKGVELIYTASFLTH